MIARGYDVNLQHMHSVEKRSGASTGKNNNTNSEFRNILAGKYESVSEKTGIQVNESIGVTMAVCQTAQVDENDIVSSKIGDVNNSSQEKPIWYWHDGQFGYYAEVFKNEGTESEYTIKLRYDDGREEKRVVDVDTIDSSNCNIIDLSVKMYHLEADGKIENPAPQLLIAHLYMKYRTPDANENTCINYRSWFEQQLELERMNGGSVRNIKELINLLKYL